MFERAIYGARSSNMRMRPVPTTRIQIAFAITVADQQVLFHRCVIDCYLPSLRGNVTKTSSILKFLRGPCAVSALLIRGYDDRVHHVGSFACECASKRIVTKRLQMATLVRIQVANATRASDVACIARTKCSRAPVCFDAMNRLTGTRALRMGLQVRLQRTSEARDVDRTDAAVGKHKADERSSEIRVAL